MIIRSKSNVLFTRRDFSADSKDMGIIGLFGFAIIAATVKRQPPADNGCKFSNAQSVHLLLQFFQKSRGTPDFCTASVKDVAHHFSVLYLIFNLDTDRRFCYASTQ